MAIRSFRRLLFFGLLMACASGSPAMSQQGAPPLQHLVEPGDTWLALALRFQAPVAELQAANWHPNPWRNPVIGDTIDITGGGPEQVNGKIRRVHEGGLLALSVRENQSPWWLASHLGLPHPFRPLHGRAIWIEGGDEPPRELPAGFQSLELSAIPAQPGWPLALRARGQGLSQLTVMLGTSQFASFINGERIVSAGATGAFFAPGAPELTIVTDDQQIWAQPWRVTPGVWQFDRLTLTGEAAAIDEEARAAERARMFQIWSQLTPRPMWQSAFQIPITQFLSLSSSYGARRSYNGGPFSSYHEGVDFSAYRGTPVYAAGDGIVALAEHLYVRGGAVVIDHGLSIYSGYYHMSAVHVQAGQVVTAGDLIGEVGTEGLSTGNHLHWDLLVAGIWVDALAWHEQNLACWIAEGWGTPCH